MRPSRLAIAGAAALALAAAAPAAAPAAPWTPARAATSAGIAFGPSVAADARGRIALGFERTLRGESRAEVRTGTLRSGVRGASVLLDRQRHLIDDVTVAFAPDIDGPVAAWRRYDTGAQRLRGAIIDRPGRTPQAETLTTGKESAYEPRFITGADGALTLVYDRRTTSASRTIVGDFGPELPLPGTGISSGPRLAVAADGTRVAAWLTSGGVSTAQAVADGTFGAPVALPTAGYARDLQLAQEQDGTMVLAWVANAGQGNAVQIAVRPAGATAFGAPVTVVPASQGAFAPRLQVTAAGEVLLAWTATGRSSGWSSAAGTLRLQRLTAAGAPVGAPIDLTAQGDRATEAVLASDGSSAAFAAWARTDGAGRRTIQARRIAPGGIVGQIRNVSPRAGAIGSVPELTGAAGRAFAAWQSPTNKIVYSIYR
jgi:hypothetical protein